MRSTAPLLILVLLFAPTARDAATLAGEADLPRPTSEQAAWQDLELGLFYHFDISVFTDGGEGDWPRQGHLDPSLYNPVKLSTDQWLEAAKSVAEPVIRKLAVYHVASSAGPQPATAKPSGWGVRQVLVGETTLPRVLLIGDSILNGYHVKAAELLRGKVNLDVWVTPKHIGSKDLPADMQAIFAEHTYDLILFNDIGLHAWEPGRIPAGQYEALTRAHLANLRKFAPRAKLIFASTTPMTTKTKPLALDPEFNPLIVERNQIAGKVMAENRVPVADYYGILATKLELAAGDRFHWTKPAYELLAHGAAAQIEHALPAVAAGENGRG